MYDTNISLIQNEQNTVIKEFDNDVLFADINLDEYIATVIRKPANIIQLEYQLQMKNIAGLAAGGCLQRIQEIQIQTNKLKKKGKL